MESNALKKSTKNNVALRFFSSMIRWILKIYEIVEWFFFKAILIFSQHFLDFELDTIKQSIINLISYNNQLSSRVLHVLFVLSTWF